MDKDKAIRGLECCAEAKCEICPYENQCFGEEICICSPMAKDMLELLKAQEAVEPRTEETSLSYFYGDKFSNHFCGECGAVLSYGQKYCSECGRAVKWE